LHDGGFCWVFEGEFKGAVFNIVIGFGLEYGAEMLQQLKQTGVESISARSEYVAIDPDGKKLTSAVTHSHHFDFACDVFKLSAINHSVGAVFVHLHDGGFCWVFEGEFKSAVFDVVIGFGLE
jgi:hypothetical protein